MKTCFFIEQYEHALLKENITICQNDSCHNGKFVSLIFSETFKEQQNLKQKRDIH